jgi:hypothetical protein
MSNKQTDDTPGHSTDIALHTKDATKLQINNFNLMEDLRRVLNPQIVEGHTGIPHVGVDLLAGVEFIQGREQAAYNRALLDALNTIEVEYQKLSTVGRVMENGFTHLFIDCNYRPNLKAAIAKLAVREEGSPHAN